MNILLVCSGGMSSAMVVKSIQEEAEKQNVTLTIEAIGSGDVEKSLSKEKVDLLLVAPQVKHRFKGFEETANKAGVPIEVIEPTAYGPMGGPKVMEQIKRYQ